VWCYSSSSSFVCFVLVSFSLSSKSSAGRTSPKVVFSRFVLLTYRSRWGIPLHVPRRKGIEDASRLNFDCRSRLAVV